MRKRVGIVFEWLPNGSLEDLLLYIRPPSRLSSRTHRKQLTPKLVLDCQAPRWASSASPGANGSANNGANGAVAARQRLPDDLANCPVSEFMTMPCNRDAIAALGHDWVCFLACIQIFMSQIINFKISPKTTKTAQNSQNSKF